MRILVLMKNTTDLGVCCSQHYYLEKGGRHVRKVIWAAMKLLLFNISNAITIPLFPVLGANLANFDYYYLLDLLEEGMICCSISDSKTR